MHIQKIFIGGWFQRTTLHLSEIWSLLKYGQTALDFPKKEVLQAQKNIDLLEVTRESGPLEYILAKTKSGIIFRIYEDGLIILEKNHTDLKTDFKEIRDYYENKLSKSLSFIFSKGAPVPKELANIKTILPYIVTIGDANKDDALKIFKNEKEDPYSILSTKNVEVYRSQGIILINNLHDETLLREIIESQIFFREFKLQLHRYLNIHRIIWEKIEAIKERGEVKGTEVDRLRGQLSSYQKTIHLIGSRIDQMDTYAKTRQKITTTEHFDAYLNPLFQLKFETLLDTHAYIKDLWGMTDKYLTSTIELFNELLTKSTKNTISSLQLITTVGVVSGIIGYLGKDSMPKLTPVGIFYFLLLILFTWIINNLVSKFYKNKKYQIKGGEINTDI